MSHRHYNNQCCHDSIFPSSIQQCIMKNKKKYTWQPGYRAKGGEVGYLCLLEGGGATGHGVTLSKCYPAHQARCPA